MRSIPCCAAGAAAASPSRAAPTTEHFQEVISSLTSSRGPLVAYGAFTASGTDVADVRAEAEALGFAEFFGDQIFGAVGSVDVEAKRVVMDRLATDLQGSSFVTFGDGPVEMREIATLIADAIEERDDAAAQTALAGRVAAISGRFAVPGLHR